MASLDHDRILRSYLSAIKATLRTNFYQAGRRRAAQDLHLAQARARTQVPDLPEPRPQFEVFVYSPRVEGVHLRFGAVARGGLRWSDRREDFRTEVLGLVKAQMVKNAVIVPVGDRRVASTASSFQIPQRTATPGWPKGIACYKTFISGLLDITDNLVAGKTPSLHRTSYATTPTTAISSSRPTKAPRRSPTSPTGWRRSTASGSVTPSRPADRLATTTRRWESPPGARGWRCRRHFRERGIDCQAEDFTCVGIGDMSGDVFGNGMLLSEHIRLVAAFDHRHIFVDPNPDAATSYAERRRLFALPRSSWADYDAELISAGGGVFARASKSIDVSPEVAQRARHRLRSRLADAR
ncbi:MAG: NAD-glutamate dehydrogenase domain-containing protein [Nocardioidaceae bacterium]